MAPPNVTMMTRLTAESQRSAKMVRKHNKHKTYPFRARGESHTVLCASRPNTSTISKVETCRDDVARLDDGPEDHGRSWHRLGSRRRRQHELATWQPPARAHNTLAWSQRNHERARLTMFQKLNLKGPRSSLARDFDPEQQYLAPDRDTRGDSGRGDPTATARLLDRCASTKTRRR